MYGKMQESGLTEIIPFICISAIWGQHPAFFTSCTSLRLTVGSGCGLTAGRWQVFFSFLSALGAQQLILELQLLMTVTSLFTEMAGNTSFLTCNTGRVPQCTGGLGVEVGGT